MPFCHNPIHLAIAAVFFTLATPDSRATAGTTNTNTSAKSDGFVVQPPFIEPALPQSAFTIPKKVRDGRDPFYPKSTRVYGTDQLAKPVVTVNPVADLALKGISGTAEEPLAIINNINFAAGEENDVTTRAGRIRIRCVEINRSAGTVLVQVGGERRELRLAPLK